jgi:TetR/AcrR family transcriptional regulator, transcriptional repressor for nem operon
MARPREFDYDASLEQAMRLFWTRGYANTSLRDLLKVMKIGEGSFYNVFNGKKALYLECLRRYNDLVTRRRLAILERKQSMREALRDLLDAIVEEISDPKTPPACLMANSLFADVLVDRELRAAVTKEFKTFESYFRKRLRAAVGTEELARDFRVNETAAILVTFLQGLFRVYGTIHDKRMVRQQIHRLLSSLGLALPVERRAKV